MYSCLDGDVEDGVASAPLVETVAAQGSSRSGLSSSDLSTDLAAWYRIYRCESNPSVSVGKAY